VSAALNEQGRAMLPQARWVLDSGEREAQGAADLWYFLAPSSHPQNLYYQCVS
jgi:hypothetical protein